MIKAIGGSSSVNITNSKNTIKSSDGNFKNVIDNTLTKSPGMQGLKDKYNYSEMTNTEKKLFNSYILQKMLLSSKADTETYQKFTYEDFQKTVSCFPPPDSPKTVFKAWENFLSKYPEDEQIKVMAQFIPSEPITSNTESYIQSMIDHCTLDEIVTGTNRYYEKSLYNDFLKELDNINNITTK